MDDKDGGMRTAAGREVKTVSGAEGERRKDRRGGVEMKRGGKEER